MISPQERLADIIYHMLSSSADIKHEQTAKCEDVCGRPIVESIYEITVYGRVQITLKGLDD